MEKYSCRLFDCIRNTDSKFILQGGKCRSIQIEYHGRTQENEEVVFANADFSVFFVGKMDL